MFKISWKNCEPSQRYGPDKISREEEERRRIVFPFKKGETNKLI
jgi:hypothetical protein